MRAIILDPLGMYVQSNFESIKAVLSKIGEHFKLESEADMCRWEDDGGAPYPDTKIAPAHHRG